MSALLLDTRPILLPYMDTAGIGSSQSVVADGGRVVGAPDGRPTEEARAAALARVNRRGTLRLDWLLEWARVFSLAVALFVVVRALFVEAYKIPSGSMERTLLVGDFLLVSKLAYGAEIPFTGRSLPRLRQPARGDVVVFQWPSDPEKNFVKRIVGLPGDTLAMRLGALFVNGRATREQYATHAEPGSDPVFEDFRWQREYALQEEAPLDGWGGDPATPAGVDVAGESFPAHSREGALRAAALRAMVRTANAQPAAARMRRVARDPSAHPSRNNWGPLVIPAAHYFVLGDNRDNSLDSRYWGFVPDSLLRGRPLLVYYSYAPDSTQRFAWLTAIRWSRLGARIR